MSGFEPGVWLLTLAYVAVAALLLNLNLATPRRGPIKVAAIALVTALYVGAWHGHKGLLGWASDDPLPERFRLHYASVEDPDKASRTPGTIYLWVSSLDGPAARREPRAYRITWDAQTARAVLDALADVERGVAMEGSTTGLSETGPVRAVEPAERVQVGGTGERPGKIGFRPVPTPALPPKL
ncbi:MAG: hypothetical protein OXG82_04785 [Gammaproteobacteria bacterium]|nr:hypothetical protein [Gammaproteobacteria bacterium]